MLSTSVYRLSNLKERPVLKRLLTIPVGLGIGIGVMLYLRGYPTLTAVSIGGLFIILMWLFFVFWPTLGDDFTAFASVTFLPPVFAFLIFLATLPLHDLPATISFSLSSLIGIYNSVATAAKAEHIRFW